MFRSRKATAPKTEEPFRPLSYADVQPIPPEGSPDVDIPASDDDRQTDMTNDALPSDPDGAQGADVMAQMAMAKKYAVESNRIPEEAVSNPLPEDPSRLYIGGDIRMKAEVEACGVIQVDGHIEASATCRELKVATTGTMIGNLTVDSAEIEGTFEGTLTVSGKLTIRSTAHVTGDIKYGSIEVENGGHLSGLVGEAPASAGEAQPVPSASSEVPTNPPSQNARTQDEAAESGAQPGNNGKTPPSRPLGPLKLNLKKATDGEKLEHAGNQPTPPAPVAQPEMPI